MSLRKFLRRRYHYFVSYSHQDAVFARRLERWLSETAGLQTWFDQFDLASGDRVYHGLAKAIDQCRGVIFLLSKASLASDFVRDEIEQALAEKKLHAPFQILLLRLDDCDVAAQWKSLRIRNWHDLATPDGPKLHLRAAVEILGRIHTFDNERFQRSDLKEVYVSRGWREGEETFADEVCRQFASHQLRLVGDLPDQPNTDAQRIARIMEGCWGHALMLPRRVSDRGPAAAYKYFQQERELSTKLEIPRIVVAETGCELPPGLAEQAVFLLTIATGGSLASVAADLRDHLYDFVEGLVAPKKEVHAFFSSEYLHNEERNELARTLVEATGTLPCHWGKDYRDMDIQGAIKRAIVTARFVVADLTSAGGDDSMTDGKPRTNVNACVEAAIAWGAGVRVLLLAAANPAAAATSLEGKTKHVPFMFRNSQIDLYNDLAPGLAPGVEFLGMIHKVVLEERRTYGRRVINHELDIGPGLS